MSSAVRQVWSDRAELFRLAVAKVLAVPLDDRGQLHPSTAWFESKIAGISEKDFGVVRQLIFQLVGCVCLV